MTDSYFSTQKKSVKGMTSHKSQYSFGSPDQPTIQKSSINLQDSQII